MKKEMAISPEDLGGKLRQIRNSFGYSQSKMLREIGFEGRFFRSNISQYERGVREPPLLVLLQYARIANISVEMLIDDDLDISSILEKQ